MMIPADEPEDFEGERKLGVLGEDQVRKIAGRCEPEISTLLEIRTLLEKNLLHGDAGARRAHHTFRDNMLGHLHLTIEMTISAFIEAARVAKLRAELASKKT